VQVFCRKYYPTKEVGDFLQNAGLNLQAPKTQYFFANGTTMPGKKSMILNLVTGKEESIN